MADLDPDHFKNNEMHRRVYSPDGISPTISTCAGGNTEPKILVVGQLPGYEKTGRIYGTRGISPTIQSRDWKDPAKIIVEGGQ